MMVAVRTFATTTPASWPVGIAAGATAIGVMTGAVGFHIPLVLAAMVGVAFVVVRMDAWQRMYSVLLVLLALAASYAVSAQKEATALWPHSRFVVAGMLFVYTCVKYRSRFAWPAKRIHAGFVVMLGAFFVLGAVSVIWTFDRGATLQNLAAGVAIVGIPVSASLSRWRDDALLSADMRVVYWTIVALAAAAMAHDAVYGGLSVRLSGFFQNSNTLGGLAAVGFAVGLGVCRAALRKVTYVLSQTLLIVVLVMTQARSGMAAAVIACLWLALRATPTERARIARAVVVLVVLAVSAFWVAGVRVPTAVAQAVDRFRPAAGHDPSYTYLSDREHMWTRALDLWEEAPLMGHGFRSAERMFRYQTEAYGLSDQNATAHSGVLQILVDSGVIGLAIVVGAVAVVVVGRGPQQGRRRALWLSTSAAAVSGVAIQSVESSIMGFGGPFAIVLWTALAAAACLAQPWRRSVGCG